jgi:uncharacterized membrane protein YdjX (TVP38/TMEM64 family)
LFFIFEDAAIGIVYDYKSWLEEHPFLGTMYLAIGHIVGYLIMVPGILFAIVAGIIFGSIFEGSILGYFICVLVLLNIAVFSGMVPFLIARYTLQKKIRELVIMPNKFLKSLDSVITSNGKKTLFILRLSPVLPVSLLNYVVAGFDSK